MRAIFLVSGTTGVLCALMFFVVTLSTNSLSFNGTIGLAFFAGFVGSFVGQLLLGKDY